MLYNKLQSKLSYERALEILKEAVAIETEFIVDAIPCKLVGMDAEQMTQHIQSVADQILVDCGYPRYYHVKTPFRFMSLLNVKTKSNFFETASTSYRKAGVQIKEDEY